MVKAFDVTINITWHGINLGLLFYINKKKKNNIFFLFFILCKKKKTQWNQKTYIIVFEDLIGKSQLVRLCSVIFVC